MKRSLKSLHRLFEQKKDEPGENRSQEPQYNHLRRRSSVTFVDAWNRSGVQVVNGKVDDNDNDNGYVISNDSAIFKVSVVDNELKVVTTYTNMTAEEVMPVHAMTEKMNEDLFPPLPPLDLMKYYREKIQEQKI
ncbi:unnamed protein product [Microthlaspi erraticum]|uniref:Uncharacterized protein n=1 Tax=Microthlaspi erraticum TaxID=1685480 RepID=A0A6D2JAI0_9BRAS|nr:unnamed protein product [Microthlaspi erraticum]